jgi:L-alanine-DL-glutamate epimerase-like enolase superfamily enzyme
MIVRGTWDWNLIKVETDAGLYGIGEAYWGWGVKDLVVNKMKGIVVGEDPLNVDKLRSRRDRRGNYHSGQRHRDCALGFGGTHSGDAGVQPIGRPVSRSGPILPDDTGA